MLLRILLFVGLGLLIYFGIRRIWKDWTNKFNHDAEEAKRIARERDRAERAILMLGRDAVAEMIVENRERGGADVTCEFCTERYHVSLARLEEMKGQFG